MTLSIIVPAYNAARHIVECIRSICAQPYADWELVIVDDGSTDETAAILADEAKRDTRIRVITQQNAGVSAARNAGYAASTGDLVWFVDADDTLESDVMAHIISDFIGHKPDCAVYGMSCDPEEATPLTLSHRLVPHDKIYEGFSPDLIFKENSHPYAFRVVFSQSFLDGNNLRFDETLSLGEDEAFLMTAYRLANRVLLSSKRVYRYRMEETSVSHRENSSLEALPAKLDKHLALIGSLLAEWKHRGLDGSCGAELLSWVLDLLVLDISRLNPADQYGYYQRLWPILQGYFSSGFPLVAPAIRLCLSDVRKAATACDTQRPAVPKSHVGALYLHTRGVAAVTERALFTIQGRGAY